MSITSSITSRNEADPVIQHLIRWAEEEPAVRVMLLTSTRAVPHAVVDQYSDYDVILVVTDIHHFHQDRAWLKVFGEVLVGYCIRFNPSLTSASRISATSFNSRTD